MAKREKRGVRKNVMSGKREGNHKLKKRKLFAKSKTNQI